jgi:hypothetical protein
MSVPCAVLRSVGTHVTMGRESASYFLSLAPEHEDAVVLALREGGAESGDSGHTWIELRVRDPDRYWIDLRLHRGPEPLLEIRIALCNDEWSIRGPLEDALTALPAAAARRPLRDEDGVELGVPAEDGWSRRLEQDYGRRRAAFVERVGDFTAPISADHVYMYVHQTRWNRDNDAELTWAYEREVNMIEQMWDPPTERDGGP